MVKNILLLIVFLFSISCNKNSLVDNKKNNNSENIKDLIKASRNTNFSDSLRNINLTNAYKSIKIITNDSLKISHLVSIAYSNLVLGNLDSFGKISHQTLKLSIVHKDIFHQARLQSDLGYYYQQKFKSDSAFYFYNNARKSYSYLGNDVYVGRMLFNMATIQESVKDFTGSEINTIKSISKLKNSKQYRNLYLAYNNLGVIYNKLGRYDLAIESNQNAIKHLKMHESNNYLEAMSLNNIGWIYSVKKDYIESLKYYNQALNTVSLFENRPQTYAMLLDNLAYSKFKLNQLDDLPKLFYKSLIIRDSLQIIDGIVDSNLHLSEYYLSKSDTLRATGHALEAKTKAEQSNYNEGLLNSYLLLSKLEPAEKAKEYLLKHIQLSDSLQQHERVTREKFTRISYETDEITQEKEAESKKKWWVILFSVLGAGLSFLLFINMKQRGKNRELLFSQKQDEANIEIYNLMLSQQVMFQDGSDKEKKRISEELHDGILGRLFGTRLSLDSLNEGKTETEIKEREEYIEELQLIEEDIRKISHNLKTSIFNTNTSFRKLVEQLVTKQSKISKFEYELNFNNLTDWESISNPIKISCYRILQESLQNINKYANASMVQIAFEKEGENLLLTIKDNGIGFNTRIKNKGIGQKNMVSRANSLNGKVEFISSPGNGTLIKMLIPL